MNQWQRAYNYLLPLATVLYKARVAFDFLIYAFGSLVSRGISFLLLPIIMHRIAPEQYGIVSLISAFTTIITAIMGLGLRQVLSLEYFHANSQKQSVLICDIIAIYTCCALPILLVLVLGSSIINSTLFFNQLTHSQSLAIMLGAFLIFYVELMYQLMQHRRQAQNIIITQTSIAAITAILSLFSIFYLDIGISGIIWSQCIATIIACILAYRYLRHDYNQPSNVHASLKKITYYVPYGLPFIPAIMANWMLSSADRWVLGYYCSLREVGIYAVADLASQLFYTVILLPWAGSYLPYIMQRYQANPAVIQAVEKENKQIMWLTMAVAFVSISAGLPLAKLIFKKIVPESYEQAIQYIWLLLIGQIFLLGSYFCSTYIQYRKKTYFLAFALFVPALFNLLLNLLLAPSYGIMGCTISTLISYAIYFMMTYLFNIREQSHAKKNILSSFFYNKLSSSTSR